MIKYVGGIVLHCYFITSALPSLQLTHLLSSNIVEMEAKIVCEFKRPGNDELVRFVGNRKKIYYAIDGHFAILSKDDRQKLTKYCLKKSLHPMHKLENIFFQLHEDIPLVKFYVFKTDDIEKAIDSLSRIHYFQLVQLVGGDESELIKFLSMSRKNYPLLKKIVKFRNLIDMAEVPRTLSKEKVEECLSYFFDEIVFGLIKEMTLPVASADHYVPLSIFVAGLLDFKSRFKLSAILTAFIEDAYEDGASDSKTLYFASMLLSAVVFLEQSHFNFDKIFDDLKIIE